MNRYTSNDVRDIIIVNKRGDGCRAEFQNITNKQNQKAPESTKGIIERFDRSLYHETTEQTKAILNDQATDRRRRLDSLSYFVFIRFST